MQEAQVLKLFSWTLVLHCFFNLNKKAKGEVNLISCIVSEKSKDARRKKKEDLCLAEANLEEDE